MVIEPNLMDFFTLLEERIPELASSKDLVDLGIFSSEVALCLARKHRKGPTFIKFSRGRIRYPRTSVIKFLKDHINEGGSDD